MSDIPERDVFWGLVVPGSMVVSSIPIVQSGYSLLIATNEAAAHRSHALSGSPHCRIVRPPQFTQPTRGTCEVHATGPSSFQLFMVYKNWNIQSYYYCTLR